MAGKTQATGLSAPDEEQSLHTYDTTQYAIDYKVHKRPALRKLVLDRTGRHEPGNLCRQHYIDILEDDYIRKATFKFLELPGELRNEIYLHLLTLKDKETGKRYFGTRAKSNHFCFPAVLRVNRLVHKEASSILYGENTAEISVSNYIYYRPKNGERHNMSSTGLGKLIEEAIVLRAEFCKRIEVRLVRKRYIGRIIPTLPEQLLWFKSVSITIDPDIQVQIDDGETSSTVKKARLVNINHALHALVSSLKTSSQLKRVSMEIKWPSRPEELRPLLLETLWPISSLTNCGKVSFIGLDDEQLVASLKPVYSAKRMSGDPLVYMRQLIEKRKTIVKRAVKARLKEAGVVQLEKQFRHYEDNRMPKSVLSATDFVNAESLVAMQTEIRRLERDVRGGLCKRVEQWWVAETARIREWLAERGR